LALKSEQGREYLGIFGVRIFGIFGVRNIWNIWEYLGIFGIFGVRVKYLAEYLRIFENI